MARFSALALAVVAATCVSATPLRRSGPACAAQNRGSSDCVSKCKGNWGWGSALFGTDRSGYVVVPGNLAEQLEAVVAQACGSSAPVSTAPKTTRAVPPAGGPVNAAPLPTYTSEAVTSSVAASSAPVVTPSSSSVQASSSQVSSSSAALSTNNLVVRPTSSSARSVPVTTSTRRTSSIPRSTTTSSRVTPTFVTSTRVTTRPTTTPAPKPTTSSTPRPQPTTSAGTGGGNSGDREIWLSEHNNLRAKHGANALTWDDALEAAAQKWANNCVWKHSGGAVGNFGENLAVGTSSAYGPAAGFKGWADEAPQYNPQNPQPSHFTQVVWKNTTKLGCATAICPASMMPGWESFGTVRYHVCEYNPPGNFNNDYARNVQV